jgi:hypothetical protein
MEDDSVVALRYALQLRRDIRELQRLCDAMIDRLSRPSRHVRTAVSDTIAFERR